MATYEFEAVFKIEAKDLLYALNIAERMFDNVDSLLESEFISVVLADEENGDDGHAEDDDADE